MTTRQWMIAVVIVGLVLAGAMVEWRRQVEYTDRFLYHAQGLEGSRLSRDPTSLFAQLPEDQRARQERAWAYHRTMRDRYRKALGIPFWCVSEDPPPP
jgi:hypothetical protein